MRKSFMLICVLAIAFIFSAPNVKAQGVSRSPDPSTVRNPEEEKLSMHDLIVARHYFKQKKAYRAALDRCLDIFTRTPNFSRMDETLYLAAMSNLLLSEKKGKQTPSVPVEKLREEARTYFARIVKEYPDSSFRSRAEDELRNLGGVTAQSAK
ncbi:MAG: hypothetical protein WKF74_17850 [Pyrinomonadaceae bacterium]